MKFENKGKWLFESEEIFEEDELDLIEDEDNGQINEVRYIDPENLDRYDPNDIEEITTASGEKRYRRKKTGQMSTQAEKPDTNAEDEEEFSPDFHSKFGISKDDADGRYFTHPEYGVLKYNAMKDAFYDDTNDRIDADDIDYEDLELSDDVDPEDPDIMDDDEEDINSTDTKEPSNDKKDTENTKEIKDIPIDSKKYPNLSKKVDNVSSDIKNAVSEIEKADDNYYDDREGVAKKLKGILDKALKDFKNKDKYEVASALSNGFEHAVDHAYNYKTSDYPKELKELLDIRNDMNREQRAYDHENEKQKGSTYLKNKGFDVKEEDWGISVKLSQMKNLDKNTLDTYLNDVGEFNIEKGKAILSISKNGSAYNVEYHGANDFDLNAYDSFDEMKNILTDKEALKEEIADAKRSANAYYSRYSR